MKEIEVKILEVNVDDIERKLRSLGAKVIFNGTLNNVYFDTEDKSLKSKNAVLRLRFDGKKAFLTLKEKISLGYSKIANELEVVMEDFDKMKSILNAMGFEKTMEYSKKKISYALDKVHFEIDFIKGIPPYLEIESEDEELIRKYVKALGFKQSDAKNWTTKQLMKHYKK